LEANNSAIHQNFLGQVLDVLKNKKGAMQLADRKFEKEFKGKKGDSVVLTDLGSPAIKNYTRNQSIVYDTTNSASVKLYLSQSKYSAVALDDVDNAETAINIMAEYQMRMADGFADEMNRFVATSVCAAAIAVGHNVQMSLSTDNIVDSIIQFKQTFENRLALQGGRKLRIAVPLVAKSLFERHLYAKQSPQMVSDNKMTTGISGDTSTFKMFEDLEISFDSTLEATNGVYQCPAVVEGGYAFFAALSPIKTEEIRLQSTFADGVRALAHYGGGIVYDAYVGCLQATFEA
jgi:hypothetical protein